MKNYSTLIYQTRGKAPGQTRSNIWLQRVKYVAFDNKRQFFVDIAKIWEFATNMSEDMA